MKKSPAGSLLPLKYIGREAESEGDSISPPPYKNPLSFPLRLATTSTGFLLLFFSKFFIEAADVIIVFISNTHRRPH